MTLLLKAKVEACCSSFLMLTRFAQDDSMPGICRNCGHKARNHFSENSPIRRRCLERDCKCDWAWNGENDTYDPLNEVTETSHDLIARPSHRLDHAVKDSCDGEMMRAAQKE
jgi:hypothetical protein